MTIKLLLKFGSDENIRDLYENGTIYMNTIQYFKNCEKKEVGDSFEGAAKIMNYKDADISIKIGTDFTMPLRTKEIHLKESHTDHIGNLYSLYAVTSENFDHNNEHIIDKRLSEFGSSCLLIKDGPYFMEQIEKKLKELNISFVHNPVRYKDYKEIFGDVGPFDKSDEYKHQNEFRIYAKTIIDEPLSFRIGSLKGKAEMHNSSDVIETFYAKKNA